MATSTGWSDILKRKQENIDQSIMGQNYYSKIFKWLWLSYIAFGTLVSPGLYKNTGKSKHKTFFSMSLGKMSFIIILTID